MEGAVQEPRPDALAFVGEGELRPDFNRVNWAATAFAPFWSLGYGPAPWGRIIWAVLLVPLVVENVVLLFIGVPQFDVVRHVVDAMYSVVIPVLAAYYGYNVDRWLWGREHQRIVEYPDLPAKLIPLNKYRRSRLFWTRIWLGLLALGLVADTALLVTRAATWRDLTPSLGFVVLAILLALDVRRRRQPA
ncbi:MAG: hypothetical protein P4L93_06485 [Coriobacteriia bacterium]|nr:hypothetical protein [Coriobacteriia bacterium]